MNTNRDQSSAMTENTFKNSQILDAVEFVMLEK